MPQTRRTNIPVTGQNPLVSQTIRQASIETHNFLGDSGIKVSKVCLGTMTFGNIDKTFGDRPGQLNEKEAHRILDRFVELGGNFIDTGVFYPFFGNTAGDSEHIIGSWLTKQDRSKIILSTNVGLPTDLRDPNQIGLSRVNLINGLDQSLKRLKTHYIDLFCVNGWDETTNVGDVMRTLNDFVRMGRVRHIGCSDLKAWQLQVCLDYAKVFNMEKLMTISCEYNLLSRGADLEIVDVCRLRRVSLLAYSPLKGGYLTDKIKSGMTKAPENTRIAAASKDINNVAALAVPLEDMRNNELFNRVNNTCNTIARKHGKTVAQVALRYLLHKDFVCSVIIGCKTIQQLEENMGCLSFALNQEDVEELDRVSMPQLQLPSPYNVNEFLKITRSRLQLHNNVLTTGSVGGTMIGGYNAVSQPIQVLTEPTLISVPPNIQTGLMGLTQPTTTTTHKLEDGVNGKHTQHQHLQHDGERVTGKHQDERLTGKHAQLQDERLSGKHQQTHGKGSVGSKADEMSHRREHDVGDVRGRMDNLRMDERDTKMRGVEHEERTKQTGRHQNVQKTTQDEERSRSGESHGIGSTLGNIAHSIGSTLTGAMSGAGLSGMSAGLDSKGQNVQDRRRE